MVTMEELIRLQKKEEAAQKAAAEKEKQAATKAAVAVAASADKVPPAKPVQSAAKKTKEKGITIIEGGSQAVRSAPAESAPQSKKDGKKRVGEQTEALQPLGSVPARVVQLL